MSHLRAASAPLPDRDKDVYEWNRELSKVPPAGAPPKQSRIRRVRFVGVCALVIAAGAVASVVALRQKHPAAPVVVSGRLTVETRPAGAGISIDGVAKGVSPLTIDLAAGPHKIGVRQGTEVRDIPVTVAAGERFSQLVELQTTPATGRLQIDSEPSGARVLVDGQPRGVSPLLLDQIAPGPHAVVLQSEVGSVDRQVTVEAGATGFIFVPLVSRGVPLSGWVALSSAVELQILENGRLVGTTATERVMMPAGRHELELVNDTLGYQATRVVTVSPGKTLSVPIELPQGTLHVNASPWAEIWIDGKRVGETPLGNVRLTIGPHEVLFRHPQFGEQRHAVNVTVSTPARLSVNLGT